MKVLVLCVLQPGGSDSKESVCNAGEAGSIPGSGRPPGEGNGNLLQYSCQENSMDRGVWWATVHGGHKEWDRTELLSTQNLLNGFAQGYLKNVICAVIRSSKM